MWQLATFRIIVVAGVNKIDSRQRIRRTYVSEVDKSILCIPTYVDRLLIEAGAAGELRPAREVVPQILNPAIHL